MSDMKWQRLVRETGLVEYLCEHGTGHPDYESANQLAYRHGHDVNVWLSHGCDGCCIREDDFPGREKDE